METAWQSFAAAEARQVPPKLTVARCQEELFEKVALAGEITGLLRVLRISCRKGRRSAQREARSRAALPSTSCSRPCGRAGMKLRSTYHQGFL